MTEDPAALTSALEIRQIARRKKRSTLGSFLLHKKHQSSSSEHAPTGSEVNESISLHLTSGAFSEGSSVLISPGSFCYRRIQRKSALICSSFDLP